MTVWWIILAWLNGFGAGSLITTLLICRHLRKEKVAI